MYMTLRKTNISNKQICIFYIVKPVLRGHLWNNEKVAW